MNKFRTHTHRILGSSSIFPIHPRGSSSRSFEIVSVHNPDDEDYWEGRDVLYVSSEGTARAVYHGPPPVHVLRYEDVSFDDPWSPYYESR